jgi:hypothetical protein
VVQVPEPSQVETALEVVVPTGHVAPLQVVPIRYFWHAPFEHLPLVPQLAPPSSVHRPAGSAPVMTGLQVPAEAGSEQSRQAPRQEVWQQTPCSQKPLPHSVA